MLSNAENPYDRYKRSLDRAFLGFFLGIIAIFFVLMSLGSLLGHSQYDIKKKACTDKGGTFSNGKCIDVPDPSKKEQQ